mmetsp:Transcript_1950/g.4183  ORF Transcript_1950/g.4183 Transcript_1950/m.4183 type:complete len:221 (-) Transcript_1950:271-933(-)
MALIVLPLVLLCDAALCTSFWPVRPTTSSVETFAASLDERAINHDFASMLTRAHDDEDVDAFARGQRLRVLRSGVVLGQGDAVFKRAADLLMAWRMHDSSAWSAIHTDGSVGSALVTLAALPHPSLALFWVVNPCRVVGSRRGHTEAAVAYATLDHHLIAGAERMRVSKDAAGEVRFEVLSLSRGAGLVGSLVFPLLVRTQQRFFDEQSLCMVSLVRSAR